MNEVEIKSKYPEVNTLYSLIEEKKIYMKALPQTQELRTASFREIEFKCPEFTCTIPVDDEYEDSDSQNQALLLQLIIYAIEEYEDCEDFLVWSTAYSLDSSSALSLDWYNRVGKTAPKIRGIIGYNISGISDYDWQLNAGAAQALREMIL